jgi:hypothetical protein
MTELGISLALGCALATNVAFLCKQRGAIAAPAVAMRRPWRSAVALFRSRWWTIGFAIAVVAWALHVAALAVAPLSLVQAITAGGLVVLSYPAERWFGHRLRGRDLLGLALAAAGLAFLAVTAPTAGDDAGYSTAAMIAFEGGAVALGLALLLSGTAGGTHAHHGLLLGAAAGLLIGVSDVAIKALVEVLPTGILALVSPWTAVAAVAGLVAFLATARALQLGEVIAVIAIASVAANCAAILGGVLVFGDPLGANLLQGLARGAAFAAVVSAAALMPAPVRAARAG